MAAANRFPATVTADADLLDGERTPASRTRSVWLLQLVLAASIVVIVLVVQTLEPTLFGRWTFSAGIAVIIALTAVSLIASASPVVPRVRRSASAMAPAHRKKDSAPGSSSHSVSIPGF